MIPGEAAAQRRAREQAAGKGGGAAAAVDHEYVAGCRLLKRPHHAEDVVPDPYGERRPAEHRTARTAPQCGRHHPDVLVGVADRAGVHGPGQLTKVGHGTKLSGLETARPGGTALIPVAVALEGRAPPSGGPAPFSFGPVTLVGRP